MLKLKSFLCYLVLLSLAFPLGNAWAKKPRFNKDSVSAITLDVVRMEACASGKGCVTASGPMQLDLLELADGKVDFANQVLLPEKTQYLQLMFGKNSTITVDDELFPLSVPGGTKSGLKLKGRKAFGKEGGFLTSLELQFKLGKKIVAQRNKIRSKDKGQRRQVSYVYSYKLKPVIKVATAEVEALPENMAAVVALPDEDVTLTLGDDFSMRIPAGAVSEATIITAEELKYFVEVKDEATGEIVRKPGLASTYELGPEGTEFDKPLEVAIGYHMDTLREDIPETSLTVLHDIENLATEIDTNEKVATADIYHFSRVTVTYLDFTQCRFRNEYITYPETEEVEPGIVHGKCLISFMTNDGSYSTPYHLVAIDRVALKDKYKLSILAKDSPVDKAGTFVSSTVEDLAKSHKAIVAMNGTLLAKDGCGILNGCYRKEVPGIYTTGSIIIDGYLKRRALASYREVYMAFGDDNSSAIPIKRFTKDNNFYRLFEEEFGLAYNDSTPQFSPESTYRSLEEADRIESDRISPLRDMIFSRSTLMRTVNNVTFCGLDEDPDDVPLDDAGDQVTAIGYNSDVIMFLVNEQGRSGFQTYQDVCTVLKTYSIQEAIQLDGGGSSQLVIDGELVNADLDSSYSPRHVANAIGLVPINSEAPEPSQAIVDSVSPSTATLNERTLFTVTGLGLSSDLRFSLDGCENVDQILANSTSMVFLCTPRAVGNQSGTIEDFFYNRIFDFTVTVSDGPSTLPVVTSVSPNEAVLDEQTIFTVTGKNLPSTLAFFVEECANLQSLGGTSTSMLFRCIPSWTTGLKDGVVKDESGGTTLYSFQVNVSDETPVTSPIVNSVTPTEAVLNQPTTFTVSGQNLPSTLAFWIGECDNVTSLGGSSTLMKFSCTPSWTLGIKNGVVKDQHGGTPLKEFTVDVSDAPSDDDLVLKEVRVTANGTLYAGSTATYTAVADLAENITTGSIPVAGDVVKTIEVTDECSWLVTLGMYADSLGGGLVQAESSAAGQEVKVKCTYYHSPSNLNLTGTLSVVVSGGSTTSPVVYSVTPDEAVLGESTVFTVSGQDLPSTLAFWIEECENLTSLGGTSTSKQFRCTPSWTTGLKDGVVKDQSGGTVLYNFTVDVSNVPATSPVVYSVTPTEAALEETTTFTVNGENLPSTLEFLLTDCTGVRSLGGSSTARQFSCTPRIRTGQKDGIIEQSGGSVLKTFTVDFL